MLCKKISEKIRCEKNRKHRIVYHSSNKYNFRRKYKQNLEISLPISKNLEYRNNDSFFHFLELKNIKNKIAIPINLKRKYKKSFSNILEFINKILIFQSRATDLSLNSTSLIYRIKNNNIKSISTSNSKIRLNLDTNHECSCFHDVNTSKDPTIEDIKEIDQFIKSDHKSNVMDFINSYQNIIDHYDSNINNLNNSLVSLPNININKLIDTIPTEDSNIPRIHNNCDSIELSKSLTTINYTKPIENYPLFEVSNNLDSQLLKPALSDKSQNLKKKNVKEKSSSDIINMLPFKNYDDLIIGKSKIHGLGIFSPFYIEKDTLLMEYKGEIIGKCMSDKRERLYKKNNIDSVYMFAISEDLIIDATLTGNKARYINHSCRPNCEAIHSIRDQSIKYCTIRDILPGEELTINYNMSQDNNEEECKCGQPECKSNNKK